MTLHKWFHWALWWAKRTDSSPAHRRDMHCPEGQTDLYCSSLLTFVDIKHKSDLIIHQFHSFSLQFQVQFTHRDFDDSSFNQNVLVLRCKNTLAYQFLRHGNSFVVRHTQVGQVVQKSVSKTRQDFSCVILEAWHSALYQFTVTSHSKYVCKSWIYIVHKVRYL